MGLGSGAGQRGLGGRRTELRFGGRVGEQNPSGVLCARATLLPPSQTWRVVAPSLVLFPHILELKDPASQGSRGYIMRT